MNAASTEDSDARALNAEIARLRAEVMELRAQVDRLDALAHQDVLIPLPNRRSFRRELDRLIARVQRYRVKSAVLYVDVDDLKAINDSFGHRVGDEALLCVSQRLSDSLRRSDFVARIGGDEFGILLENADAGEARETADRLDRAVADCVFEQDGRRISLGISIGIGIIEPGDNADEVLSRADSEMYRDKSAAAAA